MDLKWMSQPCAQLDEEARQGAMERQAVLTKPPGALGELEALAVRLAAMQGVVKPQLDNIHISVFAADHGVVAEGVSAFPQAVTAEMVRNFSNGGAAISVMARRLGAHLEVVVLGLVSELEPLLGVLPVDIAPGTANFAKQPAMTEAQLIKALEAGRDNVEMAKVKGAHLYIGGEMGIGNTTAATAVAAALLGRSVADLAGPGTGLDPQGVRHKTEVIEAALALHGDDLSTPLDVLRCVGGFDIAALTGAYIACARSGMPALVDGFIATVAALVAVRLNPGVADWLLYAHASAEPGHAAIVEALGARPLVDLGMRLGEGSGAAVVVPLLRNACALHNEMATFAEAGVSEK